MRELDKVIGYDYIKEELYRVIDAMKNPEKYRKLGAKLPKGIMFEGEPGIGKTLLSTCFIAESGRKAYTIRKNKPDGEFVDYITETFTEAAENAPSIVFLDDMDKFANENYEQQDAEEYVAVQAGIDSVKEKDVLVVATVNDSQELTLSLKRSGRCDIQFVMNSPDIEESKKIIQYYLRDKKVSDNVDIEEITHLCYGHTCAELETLVNEAGGYAGYANHDLIEQDDIRQAYLKKILGSGQKDITMDDLRRYAVHEAGHVVVAEILNPGSVNCAVVASAKSDIRGVVYKQNVDSYSCFYSGNETEIMCALGGKAATDVVLNEVDTCASIDLNKAFANARKLVDAYASFDFFSRRYPMDNSPEILNHLESVVSSEVSHYYMRTKQILSKYRRFLDEVVDALMEKKLLSYKDIAEIRAKCV